MIELRGLEVGAGGFNVGPVDLRADDGRYVVLLGPSGAGKSLLLEAVAGVRRVAAGEVRLAGGDVTALAPEQRGAGLVFQDGLLFPHLTVAANIAYGMRDAGDDERRAAATATRTALGAAAPLATRRSPGSPRPSESRACSLAGRRRSPVASASAWRWRGRSPLGHACCCWTSRSVRSTRSLARRCRRCCGASAGSGGCRCCT